MICDMNRHTTVRRAFTRLDAAFGIIRRNISCRAALHTAAFVLLLSSFGCAQWNYQQLKIGQGPSEYDRILPAEQTRRTEGGLASWSDDTLNGRSDATIVFLSRDRRIAGRMLTTRVERMGVGLRREVELTMEGELDPRLAGLDRTGPIDILRALFSEMAQFQGEQLSRDAHAYTAATIARMLAAWPGTDGAPQRTSGLAEYLDRVPSGGTTTISTDPDGILHFGYHVIAAR